MNPYKIAALALLGIALSVLTASVFLPLNVIPAIFLLGVSLYLLHETHHADSERALDKADRALFAVETFQSSHDAVVKNLADLEARYKTLSEKLSSMESKATFR